MLVDECDYSLLPKGSCAHCTGTTLDDASKSWIRVVSKPWSALSAGYCGCCGMPFDKGDVIALASQREYPDDSDRVSGSAYPRRCIASHTVEERK